MLRGPVWGGQLISEAYVNKRRDLRGPRPGSSARSPRALLLTPTTKERRNTPYFHNNLLQLPRVEVDDVLLAALLLDRVLGGLLFLNNFLLFRRRRRLRSLLLLRLRRGPPVTE